MPIDGQPKSIVQDLEDMARTYIKVSSSIQEPCTVCLMRLCVAVWLQTEGHYNTATCSAG